MKKGPLRWVHVYELEGEDWELKDFKESQGEFYREGDNGKPLYFSSTREYYYICNMIRMVRGWALDILSKGFGEYTESALPMQEPSSPIDTLPPTGA